MDLANKLGDPARVDASLSDLARGVVGSEILRIAAQIRASKAAGAEICNLTVGDFDPAQFPAPAALLDGMRAALAASSGCAKRSPASTRVIWASSIRWNRC